MFKPDQIFAIIDYETYSEGNLKKIGPWEYSEHKSTEILVASWYEGTIKELKRKLKHKVKPESWAPKKDWNKGRKDLRKGKEFARVIKDPKIIKVAHNAMFEQCITANVLPKHLGIFLGVAVDERFISPHKEWFCTSVQSSICALPRSLDGVTEALELDHVKDKKGHAHMMKWAKPKKASKADPSIRFTKDFDRLVSYCEKDIYAEVETFLTLPIMSESERELWLFDQEINFRGFYVDRDLVIKVQKLIAEDKILMTKKLRKLTNGMVQTAGQRAVIHAWLKTQKIKLPDLKGKTIEDAIASEVVTGKAKTVLELCLKLNKTSLGKYKTFLDHSTSDGRIRCSLIFNSTVHGRWGGAGLQPHNIPRGTLKYKDESGYERDLAVVAAEMIKAGCSLAFLKTTFGDTSEVFVSILRTMITATPGNDLFVSDFAAIEARVLMWLASDDQGLTDFITGAKVYEELAMEIFKRTSISGVQKDERFVGKQAFLLSGYGGGWGKFQSTCLSYNQPVSAKVAKAAINAYRKRYKSVPKLWKKLEQAAISAVENPGKTFKINNTEWYLEESYNCKPFLCCKLPSGRILYYYGPEVHYKKTPWGDSRPVLYHWTVDSKTKKFVFTKTWGGVLTQNCVGGISRDLLAASMLRVAKYGYEVPLHVHDEVLGEKAKGMGNVYEFDELMRKKPKWAKGLPIGSETFMTARYRK